LGSLEATSNLARIFLTGIYDDRNRRWVIEKNATRAMENVKIAMEGG
jgi:hypothetical protein